MEEEANKEKQDSGLNESDIEIANPKDALDVLLGNESEEEGEPKNPRQDRKEKIQSQLHVISEFKLRIFDLIFIAAKKSISPDLILKIQKECALSMKIASQDKNFALYSKIKSAMQYINKRNDLNFQNVDTQNIKEYIAEMLKGLIKNNNEGKKSEGYKIALQYFMKILEKKTEGETKFFKTLIKILLKSFLTGRIKSFAEPFFINYLKERPDLGWTIFPMLLKYTLPKDFKGSRTETQRKTAMSIVTSFLRISIKIGKSKNKIEERYPLLFNLVKFSLGYSWPKKIQAINQFYNLFIIATKELKNVNPSLVDDKLIQLKELIEENIKVNSSLGNLKRIIAEINQIQNKET